MTPGGGGYGIPSASDEGDQAAGSKPILVSQEKGSVNDYRLLQESA